MSPILCRKLMSRFKIHSDTELTRDKRNSITHQYRKQTNGLQVLKQTKSDVVKEHKKRGKYGWMWVLFGLLCMYFIGMLVVYKDIKFSKLKSIENQTVTIHKQPKEELKDVALSPTVSLANADRIFKENSKAVVVVTAYDEKGNAIGQGSGFIVRADGAVVTNYHVIGMARDIKVTAGDKILDVEGLIFTDEKNDLVILKAKAKDMPVVKLGVVEKANIGEHVYVISKAGRLEDTVSDGLLIGARKIDEKNDNLQITVPVSFGSSGSPVFNRNGEVIGVVTTVIFGGTLKLSFAKPVQLIKDKISSKSVTAIKDSGLEDYINTEMYWSHLGGTYVASGEYDEAILAFKMAIKITPDSAMAHSNLGFAYVKSGMHKEAIEACKQAIRITPDFVMAHSNLSAAYVASGMNKKAIEACKQAIRIHHDLVTVQFNLGVAYFKSGMHKEAIEAFKQEIRIDPDLADAHYYLGVAYVASGMDKKAIEALKQAIRIDPDLAMAHSSLGGTYVASGMHKEAIEALKQAIRIDPDLGDAHYYLGAAFSSLGKYKEAIGAYKQAIKVNPDDVSAHYYLGATYDFLNDREKALEQYKILKNLDPEMANKLFNMIYK